VNRASCQAAPRMREAQNLRFSLLNSLLAGKWGTESGLLETASTNNSLQALKREHRARPGPPGRSSVRSRSGPPKTPNALRLCSTEPERQEVLHWLHGASIWSPCRASATKTKMNFLSQQSLRPYLDYGNRVGLKIHGQVLCVIQRSTHWSDGIRMIERR